MTNSSLAVTPEGLNGQQRPRVSSVPESADSTTGDDAVELCEMAGLHLDPWEELVLRESLGERADGRWSAFEVGLMVSRQNGKGAILEARELVGLFLLEEELILHSAHEFSTSMEHFARIRDLIEGTPEFDRKVKAVRTANGKEGIELKTGQRLQFKARTKGGGRGWTSDLVIFDEAMDLPEASHGSILPTVSARPNPQVWYVGSAVDRWVHQHGVVFSRIRERGHKGGDSALAYFEWSADASNPEDVDTKDRDLWGQANPALGIRISEEHIAHELRSLDARTFAVERLGVGDWPPTDGSIQQIISPELWASCVDTHSEAEGLVTFAVDVTPDRSRASIGVAAGRKGGGDHVEVVDRREGTGWIVDRMVELVERHDAGPSVLDKGGPAAVLQGPLEQRGIEVRLLSANEYAQACGSFYDAVDQRTLRHRGHPDLTSAVKGAAKRPLGDSWAWSRKSSGVDISPLVACTLAHYGSKAGAPLDPDLYKVEAL